MTPPGPTVKLYVQLLLINDATVAKAAWSSVLNAHQVASGSFGGNMAIIVVTAVMNAPASFTKNATNVPLLITLVSMTKPRPWLYQRTACK